MNTKPMDCEKLLVTQAETNLKANPQSRAFVYRNLVKALNWFGSVREKLDDPQVDADVEHAPHSKRSATLSSWNLALSFGSKSSADPTAHFD